jgi:predicted alpha/beta superfamily hydrolase
MDKLFPQNDFPKAEIYEIFISKLENDGKNYLYPVVSDHDAEEKTEKFKKYQSQYDKILVLPEAVYELTPEMKLYFSLIKEGLLTKETEFNFEKMHELISKISN